MLGPSGLYDDPQPMRTPVQIDTNRFFDTSPLSVARAARTGSPSLDSIVYWCSRATRREGPIECY